MLKSIMNNTTIANLIAMGLKHLKKCPNKSVNMALVYQSFALRCVHFGHHNAKGTGQHVTQTCKDGCTFVKRYKLSPDGQTLILCFQQMEHNHELSKESTFMFQF